MNFKLSLVNKFMTIILCLGIICFTSCKKEENPKGDDNPVVDNIPGDIEDDGENKPIEIINEHTTSKLLAGTIYETTVHIFKSNIEGPKVAIVGGIHGDEVAGWKTALDLVKRNDFQGEVMIIPQANILADTLEHRYPGFKYGTSLKSGIYDNIQYSDLNRIFPGKANGNPTQKIANAIATTVESFAPDYIIDLHESRRSVQNESPLLGDLLIYGNSYSSLFCDDIVYEFNNKYLLKGETSFGIDTNPPAGSFCNYFGTTFPKSIVFTIETNRETVGAVDTASLDRRIEQQTQILDIFFKTIWK